MRPRPVGWLAFSSATVQLSAALAGNTNVVGGVHRKRPSRASIADTLAVAMVAWV